MKLPSSLSLVLVMSLCACAAPAPPGCASPLAPSITDTLYFGTDSPQGVVDEEAWAAFLQDEVTTRFPAGFTWTIANGQWQGAHGEIVRETSYVLTVVHDGRSTSDAAIGQMMTAYKHRFHQESVLRTRSLTCAQF